MEGLIEFIIYGFLNIYTRNFTVNGEILGFSIAVFCISCIIFVIIALIWAIFMKNHA